jgi:hypothetical protein
MNEFDMKRIERLGKQVEIDFKKWLEDLDSSNDDSFELPWEIDLSEDLDQDVLPPNQPMLKIIRWSAKSK